MKLSVVIPAFNEEEGITYFLIHLKASLADLPYELEVIVVNDGSTDNTAESVRTFDWPALRLVNLVGNSGHMAALEAGLLNTSGDYIVTMDSDLQHPPELLPAMIKSIVENNADVIVGIRIRGNENSKLRNLSSEVFYRVLSMLSRVHIEKNAGDFRIMKRLVADVLVNLKESNKIFRFLIGNFGFKVQKIYFESPERKYGESKYRIKQLWKLAIHSLISFSTAPLTAIFFGGVAIFLFGLVFVTYLIIQFYAGEVQPGWTSVVVLVAGLSSVQMISIGILGRYIAEILQELRARPKFIIRKD